MGSQSQRVVTPAELAALPKLLTPTFKRREEIIDGERVLLPAVPPDVVPWRTPDDPVCVRDEYGRAWEVVRLGDPPQRWKMRRPGDDRAHKWRTAPGRRAGLRAFLCIRPNLDRLHPPRRLRRSSSTPAWPHR